MGENFVENGLIIKCMERDYFPGVMVEYTSESMLMIKKAVREYLNGTNL